MKTQLEMIQSMNRNNIPLTNALLKELLLTQKMTQFQIIDVFRHNKPMSLKGAAQLYSFLDSVGYINIKVNIVELIDIISELKEEYTFSYIDKPRSESNPTDTMVFIYYEEKVKSNV
jgi:hypothetical protein